ncbi:MAG: hypothetical protein WD046_01720 [Paracoccaceae bacterium]
MSFESLKARIAMFLDSATSTPQDGHELLERLREELAGLRGMGMPPPEDLVALEKSLAETMSRRPAHPKPPTEG